MYIGHLYTKVVLVRKFDSCSDKELTPYSTFCKTCVLKNAPASDVPIGRVLLRLSPDIFDFVSLMSAISNAAP
jgi:hypothetical protein